MVRLKTERLGCVKKVALPLTPLHALCGPNETGKTTLLRSAWLVGVLAHLALNKGATREIFPLLPHDLNVPFRIQAELSNRLLFEVVGGKGALTCNVHTGAESRKHNVLRWTHGRARPTRSGLPVKELWLVLHQMADALYVRLSSDALRAPCSLIPQGAPLRLHEDGSGLAAVYDAVLARGDEAYQALTASVRSAFPMVKAVRVPARTASTKALCVELTDGTVCPAEQLGEGLLHFLAYAALPFMDRPALLLVDQPERCLHPSAVKEVMGVLRRLTVDPVRPVQILLATHSPLVLNELKPEEVSVTSRDARMGPRITPLCATPEWEARGKTHLPGALFLSLSTPPQLSGAQAIVTPPIV